MIIVRLKKTRIEVTLCQHVNIMNLAAGFIYVTWLSFQFDVDKLSKLSTTRKMNTFTWSLAYRELFVVHLQSFERPLSANL